MTIPQVHDGDWVHPVRRDYKMVCCDCGLVHRLDFRLTPCAGGQAIEFRASRDKRATAAVRREMRKRGEVPE